jgi:hypothetical protein
MTPAAPKVWVVGSVAYTGTRSSWRKPTQQQAVYEAVKAAGSDGVTAEQIVAALASTVFDKGTGCSKKNVDYYVNALRKAGYIAEKGAVGSVSPMAKADDAILAALAGLEAALVARARDLGITEKMKDDYETYQKIKARILRPSTDGEGAAALNVGMQKLVKLVLGQ